MIYMSEFLKGQLQPPIRDIGGHLSGGDLNGIVFVFDAEGPDGQPTPIEVGQILTIPDRSGTGKFLARVTNIGYGQNETWQKEVARNMNLQRKTDLEGEHTEPDNAFVADQQDQLFLEAECEMLGYIDQHNKFFSPKKLPSYFSPVRKVTFDDVQVLSSRFGDMPFGKLRSGSDLLDIGVGLFEELVPYHIGIFAQTGGGKSNTILNIIGKGLESEGRVGMLAFDPHGEYIKELTQHPLANDHLSMYSLYNTSPGVKKIRVSYKDITASILINLKDQFGWTQAQEEFLREVSFDNPNWFYEILNRPLDRAELEDRQDNDQSFLADMARLAETGTPPSISTQTLQDQYRDFKVETIRSIRRKLRQAATSDYIVEDNEASNTREILIELKKGKVVLMDIAGLEGMHELLISSLFTKKVYDTWNWHYANRYEEFLKMPVISVIMEEAQRVLQNISPGNIFASVCSQGRKFKVGFVAITQEPNVLHENILSQINTYIILGIANKGAFDVLAGKTKKPIDNLRYEIRALMPGQAIMTNPLSPFAVPFQVNYYPDYIRELRQKFSKRKSHAPTVDEFADFM